MPVLVTVTIKYDTVNKRFTYDPPYVPKIDTSAASQPEICWKCEVDGATNNNFAIHFVGPVPTKRVRWRSTTGQIVAPLVVVGQGPPCRYHYFVAVGLENGEIFTDDPEIIVW